MTIYPEKRKGKLTGRFVTEVTYRGRRLKGTFTSFNEANDNEVLFRTRLEAGEHGTIREGPNDAPKTLLGLLDRAAPLLWGTSDWGDTARALTKRMAGWLGGNPRLDQITTASVDIVIGKLKAQGLAASTINGYMSVLSGLLRWAQEREYLKVLPSFKDAWQEKDEGRIRWITDEEEASLTALLRAYGREDIEAFVVAAIRTGARRNELLSAQPENLHATTIHTLDGPMECYWLEITGSNAKTGKSRMVPLTLETYTLLKSYLPWSLSKEQLRFWWAKAREALGLKSDPDFVLHACRHTCATRLIEAGVNLRVVQLYLGHSDINTTLKYTHVSNDLLARAAYQLASRRPLGVSTMRVVGTGAIEPQAGNVPLPANEDMPLAQAEMKHAINNE